MRTWNKASSIVQALERHNIPYITAGVNQLFEMEEVQAALGIFNYLYGDIDSDELKEKWLNIPHAKVSPEKIDLAILKLSEKNPNIENIMAPRQLTSISFIVSINPISKYEPVIA